jgi:rare lipoprotein A
MITSSHLIVVIVLEASFLWPMSAIDGKPDECGLASVYSTTSEETASGEDTQLENSTAAHRSLPFGTLVRVNSKENGRSTVVRITDRGPFIGGRIVDVSQVAARELGFSGLAQVCLELVLIPESPPAEWANSK